MTQQLIGGKAEVGAKKDEAKKKGFFFFS